MASRWHQRTKLTNEAVLASRDPGVRGSSSSPLPAMVRKGASCVSLSNLRLPTNTEDEESEDAERACVENASVNFDYEEEAREDW